MATQAPTAEPTAAQLREYLSGLRNFTGVTGTFDFKKVPQRGVDDQRIAGGPIVAVRVNSRTRLPSRWTIRR